jgi:hypothetical protein
LSFEFPGCLLPLVDHFQVVSQGGHPHLFPPIVHVFLILDWLWNELPTLPRHAAGGKREETIDSYPDSTRQPKRSRKSSKQLAHTQW